MTKNDGAITDLTGLSGLAKSLAGPITAGIGKLFHPYFFKRENSAQIDAFQAWDIAAKGAGLGLESAELTIGERTEIRVKAEAIQRQDNRERIAHAAIEHVEHESAEEVSDLSPPDNEWVDHFWRLAEHISTDEIQKFWGLILARRATCRAACSARTLNFLSLLSADEAKIIDRASRCVIKITNNATPTYGYIWSTSEFGDGIAAELEITNLLASMLRPLALNTLGPAGLYIQSDLGHSFETQVSSFNTFELEVADRKFKLQVRSGTTISEEGVFIGKGVELSKVGAEIIDLLKPKANDAYVQTLIEGLKLRGITLIEATA